MLDIVAGISRFHKRGYINKSVLKGKTWKGSAENSRVLRENLSTPTPIKLQNLGRNGGKKSTNGGAENTSKCGMTIARLHLRRLQDDKQFLQSIFLHMEHQNVFSPSIPFPQLRL
ncbi:MAG: hypothetical protein P0116_02795 [Candidatus Nitrosocosmicus sp.]|nr:hypothetical protein [Candidatus Nitrosocosmicus sp.]